MRTWTSADGRTLAGPNTLSSSDGQGDHQDGQPGIHPATFPLLPAPISTMWLALPANRHPPAIPFPRQNHVEMPEPLTKRGGGLGGLSSVGRCHRGRLFGRCAGQSTRTSRPGRQRNRYGPDWAGSQRRNKCPLCRLSPCVPVKVPTFVCF